MPNFIELGYVPTNNIISKLDPAELLNCRSVCKYFRQRIDMHEKFAGYLAILKAIGSESLATLTIADKFVSLMNEKNLDQISLEMRKKEIINKVPRLLLKKINIFLFYPDSSFFADIAKNIAEGPFFNGNILDDYFLVSNPEKRTPEGIIKHVDVYETPLNNLIIKIKTLQNKLQKNNIEL